MTRHRARVIVGAVLVLSALTAGRVSATTLDVSFWVTPAVGESAAAMTCGWHSSCKYPYPFGTGIDWNDNNGTVPESPYALLRAWVYARPSSGDVYVGSARLYWWQNPNLGNCNEVVAQIRRPKDAGVLAEVRYLHVKRWDIAVEPIYGNERGRTFKKTAGKMVDDSANRCSWTGLHAHVWHADGLVSVIRNTEIPNASACGSSACSGIYRPDATWDRRLHWGVS